MITRNYFKIVRVFPDPSDYFYIKNESLEENQVGISMFSNAIENMNLEYSFDKVNWTRITSMGYTIYIPAYSYVYLRNTSGTFSDETGSFIAPHNNISIGGDIRTLLDYTDVGGVLAIPQYGFNNLFAFQNDSTLTDISNLSFGGITTVGNYGLYCLFKDCSFTTAMDMSSITSVGDHGMHNMYSSCYSLTSVPNLSSLTSVGEYGMSNMFDSCSSLTTGSDLRHLTSVGNYGLEQLYNNCNNLTSAYAPNVSTWDSSKTNAWLSNVASTGVLYKPANLTIPTGISSGVPDGWTTQTY